MNQKNYIGQPLSELFKDLPDIAKKFYTIHTHITYYDMSKLSNNSVLMSRSIKEIIHFDYASTVTLEAVFAIVKKCRTDVYQLLECPDYIEEEVWGHCIQLGEPIKTQYFHSSWLDKLQEVCDRNSVELIPERKNVK